MQPIPNNQQTSPLANFWLKQIETTQTSYKDTHITTTSSYQHKHTSIKKSSTSLKKTVSKQTPPWRTVDQNTVVSSEHIRGMQQRKTQTTTSPQVITKQIIAWMTQIESSNITYYNSPCITYIVFYSP
jgi:hypothetical protein